ncbi:hypothetical protein F5Y15DRAFT_20395 [Xylariaceae sp. FL0016]|nr:hypothetical protein F5Y15DRAFT_20395 [Xylariaceae sp. FL0016]
MKLYFVLPLLAYGLFSQSTQASPAGSDSVGEESVTDTTRSQSPTSTVTQATLSTTISSSEAVTATTSLVFTSSAAVSSQTGTPDLASLFAGVSTLPPTCAIACQSQFAAVDSTATMPDLESMCTNTDPAIEKAILACVMQKCTVSEALQAKKFTAELCHEPTHDKTAIILGAVWGFEAFGFIGLFLRILSRFLVEGRKIGVDDLLAILVLAANITAGAIVTIATVDYGYGKDIWMLTPDQITHCLMYMITITPVYIFSVGILKVALIIFYLRIFDAQSGNKRFRIMCWVMMAISIGYTTAHIFTSIFNCQPISFAWTSWDGLHQGKCGDRGIDGLSHAIMNVCVDFILFFMPIPKLWRLNMSTRKTLLIITMFAFGLCTTACSIVRLSDLNMLGYSSLSNGTVTTVPFMIWTIAECKFGLFCACIPMSMQSLCILLTKLFGSIKSEAQQSHEPSKRSGGSSDQPSSLELGDVHPASRRGRKTRDPTSLALEWIDDDDETEEMSMKDEASSALSSEQGSQKRLSAGLADFLQDSLSVISQHDKTLGSEIWTISRDSEATYEGLSAVPGSHLREKSIRAKLSSRKSSTSQ